jgi:hypothetical protein
LLATGIKPALLHLTPWYAGPDATAITSDSAAAQEDIRRRAMQAGPGAGPFVQELSSGDRDD